MFNPKGNSLLDEQLTTSGLEMNWVGAVIGAVATVASGVMASRQASSNNARSRNATKKQRKHNKKVAKKTNKYNKQVEATEKANYFAMRDYNREVALQNWTRGKEIQDYQFDSAMKQFEKSQAIGASQLGLNSKEAALSIESEERALHDSFLQKQFDITDSKVALRDEIQRQNLEARSIDLDLKKTKAESKFSRQQQLFGLEQTYAEQNINRQEQFVRLQGIKSRKQTGTASIQNTIEQLTAQGNVQKESAMIEGLIAEGQASLGQAGKSTAKAMQSNRAALQRSLTALSSEMSGKRKQAGIQLAELNAEMSLAETGVGLNLLRIGTAISDAERDTRLGLQRIGKTEELALAGSRLQADSIIDAINIANRDYDQNREMISANYKSAKSQSKLNIKNIGIQKKFADVNTRAGMMLKPEKLPYNPKPKEPPEHIFLKSQKAIPGFVPPAAQQNVYAPLVQAFGSAGSDLVGVDFTK